MYSQKPPWVCGMLAADPKYRALRQTFRTPATHSGQWPHGVAG